MWGRSLKKEIATHSNILAWKIPCPEKPGGLPVPWVAKKVRHDLATKEQNKICICLGIKVILVLTLKSLTVNRVRLENTVPVFNKC